MTIERRYFEWMYELVFDKRTPYKKLLKKLHSTQFIFTIPLDGNRADDGIELRYRFGRESHYSMAEITYKLDNRDCSILEMMIALAIRCEDNIMDNSEYGNRTGEWFWNMLVSLGLDSMSDSKYDEDYVDYILERFLNRDYKRNGEGGLFTTSGRRDMRSIEIWYQMHLYLEEAYSDA